MLNQDKVDRFFQEFSKLLPDDLRRARADLEKNVKAAMQNTFDRMDLVTREEFDAQRELLARTRALVDELQARVDELEHEQGGNPPDPKERP